MDHYNKLLEGHLWVEPSVDRLRVLMRCVMSNREDGMSKGRRAREDMLNKYSLRIVTEIVIIWRLFLIWKCENEIID